jgi:cytosine permease
MGVLMRNLDPASTPMVDRPVSEKNLSSVGNFFGLYGGEHIAATEFVIGATLVTWGCSAKTIVLGLILGNLFAVLSFTLATATMGTSTRLTLYSYLKKVLGPIGQQIYNFIWVICSVTLAAAGICVSATAIRAVVGVPVQQEWYPTDIRFVIIVLILGAVVTFIAANGFEACAKFASTCVPWMIVIFLVCAIVALPQLARLTGVPVESAKDIWNVFSSNVGSGSGTANAEPFTIWHVACFAWLCNLAWHLGLNDMGLFRFAKNWKYGFITSIGMFVGHFFAWICVAIMGAAAVAILKQPIGTMDSGSITLSVVGLVGICAVVVAGWTTANPTIYRTALSLNSNFPKMTQKKATYITGIVMTVMACFPAMTRITNIVTYLGWITVGVGAMCIMEQFVFPKIGMTRYWAMYKEKNINWAAIITWAVCLIFVAAANATHLMHGNFIFIPEYIIGAVLYTVLAALMGARGDFRKEVEEQKKYEAGLKKLVDDETEEQIKQNENHVVEHPFITKILAVAAYVCLAVILGVAIAFYKGSVEIELFKSVAFAMTIVYFILNGSATVIKYRSEANVLQ